MKKYLKPALPILALIILIIPGYTYFVINQNLSTARDFTSTLFMIFRLFGLYAFILIWFQLILGPMMTPLSRLYGSKILKLHRITSTLGFCLAILHWLLFHLASILVSGENYNFLTSVDDYVGPDLILYGFFGPAALTLLFATVLTALFMRRKYFVKIWRRIHILNYLIFIMVFLHSFRIGSDTQTEPLMTKKIAYG